jgi:hypothetical protein
MRRKRTNPPVADPMTGENRLVGLAIAGIGRKQKG